MCRRVLTSEGGTVSIILRSSLHTTTVLYIASFVFLVFFLILLWVQFLKMNNVILYRNYIREKEYWCSNSVGRASNCGDHS